MGYDLVTWVPAIGGAGADQWDPPADKLWAAGPSAGYSATPAIAEINAGRDFNQIIALANRRALRSNACFGTALGTLSYWPTDGNRRINMADLTLIRLAIDAIRAAEGFDSFPWVALATVPYRTVARCLGELRQALRAAGIMVPQIVGFPVYRRDDNPFGTLISEDLWGTLEIGQRGAFWRLRQLASFRLPDWLAALNTAVYRIILTGASGATNFNLYRSNTDDHVPTLGTPYNTDNLEGGVPAVDGLHDISVAVPALIGRAGEYWSSIFAEANDVANVSGGAYSLLNAFPALRIDFGA